MPSSRAKPPVEKNNDQLTNKKERKREKESHRESKKERKGRKKKEGREKKKKEQEREQEETKSTESRNKRSTNQPHELLTGSTNQPHEICSPLAVCLLSLLRLCLFSPLSPCVRACFVVCLCLTSTPGAISNVMMTLIPLKLPVFHGPLFAPHRTAAHPSKPTHTTSKLPKPAVT